MVLWRRKNQELKVNIWVQQVVESSGIKDWRSREQKTMEGGIIELNILVGGNSLLEIGEKAWIWGSLSVCKHLQVWFGT